MSHRLSSTVSVASVSSEATVKASNRDIKMQRKIENITDSEQACFAAMWLCINKSQGETLHFLLGRLIMQNISAEERNDTLSIIDHVLHLNYLTDAQNDTVDMFMTLLRDLAAPGMRDMHLMAYRACLMMENGVATPSGSGERTVDVAPAVSRSHEGDSPTILPAEKSGCSSSVTSNSEN